MTSEQRFTLAAGAILGFAGIALGAFGAHALRGVLTVEQSSWWATAVQYQLVQAVALLAISNLHLSRLGTTATLMAGGCVIFSVSLYAMALTDIRWLGAITPLGGLCMLAGWAWLGWSALREPTR